MLNEWDDGDESNPQRVRPIDFDGRELGGTWFSRWYQPRNLVPWPAPIVREGKFRFYKHLPGIYARDLVERGEILVGTLESFRRSEEAARGDFAEGDYFQVIEHFSANLHGQIEDYLLPTTLPHFEREGPEPVRDASISGVGLAYKIPDAFVYCMSHSRKKSTNLLFSDSDTCVEILQPTPFFEFLGLALNRIVPLTRTTPDLSNCVYQQKTTSIFHKPTRPIQFIKPPSYSKQREIRAFWWPATENPFEVLPKPGVLRVPELVGLCRIVPLTN